MTDETKNESPQEVLPPGQKYALTILEASSYFSIGVKKLRRIAEEHLDSFALWQGKRLLIIRPRLEAYILSCLQNEEGGNNL